ncbi:hypothetical protein KAU87_01530 [Candidatus Bathyarchaeota archaeon]|nr:hypothetical protein [Candidatus Bathyarchaeota archaeon]
MVERDEFSKDVKETLAKRVGTLCSNPQCSVPTYGPSESPSKSLNKGVAAHIRAAARGGPRYEPNMSSEERKSISNGIWLCESCAKLIDTDQERYTIEVLERWKSVAEERARKALENSRVVNFGPDFADTILLVTIQRHSFYPSTSHLGSGKYARRKITIRPIRAKRQLIGPIMPITLAKNLCPPGFWLVTLTCQNQGTGVDQYIKIDIHFKDGKPAILSTEILKERVHLSGGGLKGSSFASFFIRELLPNEKMAARIVARSDMEFEASLWTQNSGDSSEVFIYELLFGEEEHVGTPPWKRKAG